MLIRNDTVLLNKTQFYLSEPYLTFSVKFALKLNRIWYFHVCQKRTAVTVPVNLGSAFIRVLSAFIDAVSNTAWYKAKLFQDLFDFIFTLYNHAFQVIILFKEEMYYLFIFTLP